MHMISLHYTCTELKLNIIPPCTIQDLQYDPEDSDDFSTVSDDRGKAILAALQEEKRRKYVHSLCMVTKT